MVKSATFGVMHLAIAFAVSYALTGSMAIAGAITLVEPVANTVAHYPKYRSLESARAGFFNAGAGLRLFGTLTR